MIELELGDVDFHLRRYVALGKAGGATAASAAAHAVAHA